MSDVVLTTLFLLAVFGLGLYLAIKNDYRRK
jgi:hypothetical protein